MNDIVTLSDPLAERAHDAIRAYTAGVAKQQKGRQEIIAAIVEYGTALLEGRKKCGSNNEFGKWIIANKLDRPKPFDNTQNRHAARQIAEIVILTKIREDEFAACPNTRPSDIMAWVRKQPWFEKKAPSLTKATTPKRKVGRPRKGEERRPFIRAKPPRLPPAITIEDHRKWVDPDFNGTPTEFVDKYGHVQSMTAEQYATMRYSDWALAIRSLAKYAKGMPSLPNVDHNWLRSPRTRDVGWMTEALEVLRPMMAEAEALLERAKESQKELA